MPSWVEDHPTWQKAKEAALKTYKESDENFYAIVTSIYEKMGGKVKHKEKAVELDEMVDFITAAGTSEGAREAWLHRHHGLSLSMKAEQLSRKARDLQSHQAAMQAHYDAGGQHHAEGNKSLAEYHDNMIAAHRQRIKEMTTKASESDLPMNEPKEFVLCQESGVVLAAAKKWEFDIPTTFQWMPGGVSTINAHFNGKPIELTVAVDAMTAKAVQASYEEWFTYRPKQTPFGCVEHREEEAALRLPKGVAAFEWHDGTVAGEDAGIYCTAVPTELGVKNVNGRIHSSWSPSFTTDAEYSKAKIVNERMVFPANARGSRENPAKVTGVAFSVGSLTNKPAFRNISPVRAKEMTASQIYEELGGEPVQAVWSDAARSAAQEARRHHTSMASEHRNKAYAHEASASAHQASMNAHSENTHGHHRMAMQAHLHAHNQHLELNGKAHEEHAEKHRQMVEHHLKHMGKTDGHKAMASEKPSEFPPSYPKPNDGVAAVYAELAPKEDPALKDIYATLAEPPDPMQEIYAQIK